MATETFEPLQVRQFPVKVFEKYFPRNYCATIRSYSAKRRHYSLAPFCDWFSAAPMRKTCAIIRPFTRRANWNFPGACSLTGRKAL
jgi:hypothetical protein